MAIRYLTTATEIEQMLDASQTGPIWILKHSDQCDLSAKAFDAFVSHSEASARPHWVLVVQDVPGLSDTLAVQLNVRHETPQALLVVDRHARWNASHRRITAAALNQAEG